MNKPLFSIIIPVRVMTDYLRETLKHLESQSYKSFETLVITDKISRSASPALKRNLGAKKSEGIYLAFLDDDSFPDNDWLLNAKQQFDNNPDLAAVCGPCLTPPLDNPYQQASGLVWSSYLGSGGAGSYRNQIASARFVDDYPSVNLIVKKSSFKKVGGFNTHHWPGEDTILCLDLVYSLHQKILYHPSVKVFHHRRNVIIPHLQQITRYALHRGNFAKIYPKTSFRLGYLIPSLFAIYCLILPISYYVLPITIYPLFLYLILLFLTFIKFLFNNSLFISLLAVITIPITHLYYGILFIVGYFSPGLKFIPHKLNKSTNKYLGG